MGRVYVTRPAMPPLGKFTSLLEEVWRGGMLSNCGAMHDRLQQALRDYMGVRHLSLFANGTLPMMAALKALAPGAGEVVTTPFSFVAGAHAVQWCGHTPVFADIQGHNLCLDPAQARRAIGPRTVAIMPVHVYGLPCDVEGFDALGREYGLPVIYDGAHTFGVKWRGHPLAGYGDACTLSFHATKVYNTAEGGAVVCRSAALDEKLRRIRNFGLGNEHGVREQGLNGKLDELRSAYGLATLPLAAEAIGRRAALYNIYKEELAGVPGISFVPVPDGLEWNYAYCPVRADDAVYPGGRDALCIELENRGVFPRKYFHPLISDMPLYAGAKRIGGLPVARAAARQVLCLPLYPDLPEERVREICSVIRR